MIVARPVYLAVTPGGSAMVTLPSKKIVPCTVSSFVVAFQESSPRVVVPAIDLHVYDAAGVRLIAVVGVALQLIELSGTPLTVSNLGGEPVDVVQGESGPRSAFWYQKPMLLGLPPAGEIIPPYGAQQVRVGM